MCVFLRILFIFGYFGICVHTKCPPCNDITVILLKMTLSTRTLTPKFHQKKEAHTPTYHLLCIKLDITHTPTYHLLCIKLDITHTPTLMEFRG
jgi:hypothetical protein